jgi:hypothetical protein
MFGALTQEAPDFPTPPEVPQYPRHVKLIDRWERIYASDTPASRLLVRLITTVVAVAIIAALAWAAIGADWITDKVDSTGRSPVEQCLEDSGGRCTGRP